MRVDIRISHKTQLSLVLRERKFIEREDLDSELPLVATRY